MRLKIGYQLKKSRSKGGKCPIYLRFTYNNKRVELSTGIFVPADLWDEKTISCTGPSPFAESVNNQLTKTQTNLRDTYNRLVSLGEEFDVIDLKNALLGKDKKRGGVLEIFDYYLETIENNIGKGYAKRTLKHYKVSRKKLMLYIKSLKRNDYPMDKVNYEFLNGFDMFLKANYNVHQNTAWNYHKHLRRVMNLAVAMEYIDKNPYARYQVKLEQTSREFISMHELKTIESKEIKKKSLDIVRDAFVFACYTGLSYADIYKLSAKHLELDGSGKEWIIIHRSKNSNRCMIPLFPNAKAILQKYSDFPEDLLRGRLLPILCNQKMNQYLKDLAKLCGIEKNMTMHVARHTFATSVTLSNGVPIETVSKILGHTSLKTTQIYAKVLAHKISADMDVLQKKLNLE